MDKKIEIVKKGLGYIFNTLGFLLCIIITLFCFSIRWMFNTWTNLTMDELVFHLTSPLDGTNEGMILDYLNQCAAPVMLILLMFIIILISVRKYNSGCRYIIGGGVIISLITGTICVLYTWNNLEVSNYMENRGTYSTFIDDNYINPSEVEISFPEKRRNLIYIYLESMETTYTDVESGGAFDFNCIPELTELAQKNEDFSGEDRKLNGGHALEGATWTAAAMFAQTSGIPLTTSAGNNMDTQDSFYPNTITLGDILEQAGYSQTLLIGSDATFGGRKLYFSSHGNYDILDYYYAINNKLIPEDYYVWWGYEDEKLFGFAKERLSELSEQGNPFNLTMLTVDTHFEDGYVCTKCSEDYGENQYANVMKCSSEQVAEFIEWIQMQDFYENTTIVLVGDHPTMDSDFCEDIKDSYERKVYTCFINPATGAEIKDARNFTTFDMFPTTLGSMGVSIDGGRLGLGTNLFSHEPTLTERFGLSTVETELGKKSKLIEELAKFDENKTELKIRNGETPTATVIAETYDYITGVLPVTVTDLFNIEEGIASVLISVWNDESKENMQWIQLQQTEEGIFVGNINVPEFDFITGNYYIEAYVVDNTGNQFKVGETIGIVE